MTYEAMKQEAQAQADRMGEPVILWQENDDTTGEPVWNYGPSKARALLVPRYVSPDAVHVIHPTA